MHRGQVAVLSNLKLYRRVATLWFYELTCVVGGTKTSVVVDSVDAGGPVLAVVVFAFVSVGLASRALKAQRTLAAVMACNQCVQLVSEYKDGEILKLMLLTCSLPPPPLGRFLRWRRGRSRRR